MTGHATAPFNFQGVIDNGAGHAPRLSDAETAAHRQLAIKATVNFGGLDIGTALDLTGRRNLQHAGGDRRFDITLDRQTIT
jgi:hypothetical protein